MAPSPPKAAVHFQSLGCPKNLIDTEVMLGSLAVHGYAIAERLEDADVAVVNTCSFIESAREESIQAVLDVAERKGRDGLRAVIVTGCLPQRYGAELARELPEVDAFVGTGSFQEIALVLDETLADRSRGIYVEAGRTHLYDDRSPRVLVGQGHTAYVKIAEGCDRACSFCAIPAIRGRFQSRTLDSVIAEAEQLASLGVREINLVAQDSTAWGKDLPAWGMGGEAPATETSQSGRPRLETMLRALDEVEGLDWIRLLYVYPTALSDELIEVLASAQRVLPYVDVPLQHASDRLLALMRRGSTEARQRRLVERLRQGIPDVTLRTTYMVGFPGESEEDFVRLCDFVRETRFDRVGVFRYSDEEGTAAYRLPEKVPRDVARERYHRLLEIQQEIMLEKLESKVGEESPVLVDAVIGGGLAQARLPSQAPEIDGVVFLKGDVRPGDLVPARITGVRDADLEAELIGDVVERSTSRPASRS
jgi:ribosomal protein S12 methylthiotransferase